jgi:hypothetical protein
MGRYWERISDLEMRTKTWPPSVQVDCVGQKNVLIRHLDFIASQMKVGRPKTTMLKRGDPIPEETVLKRTHSDCGSQVILPKAGRHPAKWDKLQEGPPGSVWMSQEFVGHLRECGEWRVVMVGGKILYVVHTVYDKGRKCWNFVEVKRFLSLDEIR